MKEQQAIIDSFSSEEAALFNELFGLIPQEGILMFGASRKIIGEEFASPGFEPVINHLKHTDHDTPLGLLFTLTQTLKAGLNLDHEYSVILIFQPNAEMESNSEGGDLSTHLHTFMQDFDPHINKGIGMISIKSDIEALWNPIKERHLVNTAIPELITLLRGNQLPKRPQPKQLT